MKQVGLGVLILIASFYFWAPIVDIAKVFKDADTAITPVPASEAGGAFMGAVPLILPIDLTLFGCALIIQGLLRRGRRQ